MTGALHVSTDVVIIRCFEIDAENFCSSVNEYNSKFCPILYAHLLLCVCCGVGDSSCVSWSAVFSINFEAPDDDHIGRNM
jgi:hypothetical protein